MRSTLAQRPLLSNPYHLPSLTALAWAYQHSGQGQLQQQACRQLLRRAGEVSANGDAPELPAARQVLQTAA